MKFEEIYSKCGANGGNCPKVLQSENGDYLVQGYITKGADRSAGKSPAEQNVVRLPHDFFAGMVKNLVKSVG